MLGLPAPFVPHSASLSPATATRVLSTLVPVSAPPPSLDECLFSILLVLVPLAVRFSVSSGCAKRRSVSTYAAILVPPRHISLKQTLSVVVKQKWSCNTNLSLPEGLLGHTGLDPLGEGGFCQADGAQASTVVHHTFISRPGGCAFFHGGWAVCPRAREESSVQYTYSGPRGDPAQQGPGLRSRAET